MISAVRSKPLRVGFLALADAAPFAAAQARGLFVRHGLAVELRREVGWATIREKVIGGELDAAQSPAPMLWATRLGLDSAACPVLTGLILNLHGNAITLSERLWAEGVRDGATLREAARRRQGERRLALGVVFSFSSHHLLLRSWLLSAGLDPDRDVRLVVVPPAQMFRNLVAGTIEGYCAGEPWTSLAVREGQGWCPAWSAALRPGHVEKVLMVTERFAERRPAEHAALISALAEACAWCDQPENREELAELMAGASYLNQPARVLRASLGGRFDCGHGRIEDTPDFHLFHRGEANAPTEAKAADLQEELRAAGVLGGAPLRPELPGQLFREDLFRAACPALCPCPAS